MKLTLESVQKNRDLLECAGYRLPAFRYDLIRENTLSRPQWIHFGAGNLFRAFQANLAQRLLNEEEWHTGLIVAEGFDYEIIEKGNLPHDNLSVLATLKSDNTVEKTLIASVMESLVLDTQNREHFARLKEIFRASSLQLASFTITEKGYLLKDSSGNFLPAVKADLEAGPSAPISYLGKVTALLYERYQNSRHPIAFVSMDNCSHNGDLLRTAILTYAQQWETLGLVESGFADYAGNPLRVSFPWTMIDKITPRPDSRVEAILKTDGFEDMAPFVTSKNTYLAPFVNAEECEYLVIEDSFPNGRPCLEKVGVLFTSREIVEKAERMKVCTCLNPLHTALAIFGCLLNFSLICDEMQDPALCNLVQILGRQEGLPAVEDPEIIHPQDFLDTVLRFRLPNSFLPDSPQRIATDTSQKLAIRFGQTIRAYEKRADLKLEELRAVPFVLAGWLRYLMGVQDDGTPFTPSPDPLLEYAGNFVAGFQLNRKPQDLSGLDGLLSDTGLFGTDLTKNGLSAKVKEYFSEMICGLGAVRDTLDRHFGG